MGEPRLRVAAVWALPRGDGLQQAIDRLARATGRAAFPAHLTVVGSFEPGEPARALERLATLAGSTGPLTVPAEGVAAGDRWSRALYLRCGGTVALDVLVRAACEVFGVDRPDPPPHVSLWYGPGAPPDASGVPAGALSEVTFDRLAIAGPTSGRWEDVETWRVLGVCCLAADPEVRP